MCVILTLLTLKSSSSARAQLVSFSAKSACNAITMIIPSYKQVIFYDNLPMYLKGSHCLLLVKVDIIYLKNNEHHWPNSKQLFSLVKLLIWVPTLIKIFYAIVDSLQNDPI